MNPFTITIIASMSILIFLIAWHFFKVLDDDEQSPNSEIAILVYGTSLIVLGAILFIFYKTPFDKCRSMASKSGVDKKICFERFSPKPEKRMENQKD